MQQTKLFASGGGMVQKWGGVAEMGGGVAVMGGVILFQIIIQIESFII